MRKITRASIASIMLLNYYPLSPLSAFGAADTLGKLGFLIVAPDRGFFGNKTVEERFGEYRKTYEGSRLFFMTRRLQRERLTDALKELFDSGYKRLVVLPLIVSEQEELWRKFRQDLEAALSALSPAPRVDFAEPFGASHLASEILLDRIREISRAPEQEHLTILGWGATDARSEAGIREALTRLFQPLSSLFPFRGWSVEVLWSERDSEQASEKNREVFARIIDQAARPHRPVLVPFFLGYRADGHMSVEGLLRRQLAPYRIEWQPNMPDEHLLLSRWLKRASARFEQPTAENFGLIVLAHGSDQIWNEEIRKALEPVARKYDTEFSFNMADPALLQKAVDALESRGKRIIAIYRLFALERSFADSIALMIGESPRHGAHGGHHSSYQPRIRSGSHIVSFGGLEDHPLFAEALLERVLSLSQGEPDNESVLLVAHGAGSDEDDEHWRKVLGSIARRMQQMAKTPFHSIAGVTLREDWPDKRRQAIEQIEKLVEGARQQGLSVLAVEARVNGPGPTRRFLQHLDIPINDDGFVPHPNLSRLVLQAIDSYMLAANRMGKEQEPADRIR